MSHTAGRARVALLLGAGVLAACVPQQAAPGQSRTELRVVSSEAFADGNCVPGALGDLSSRQHFDPAEAPPAAAMYDVPLPAGGDHFGAWIDGVPPRIVDTPIDVRALVHNMEHGAVVVWVDPTVINDKVVDVIGRWRDQLGPAGFDNPGAGASLFVSLMPEGVQIDGGIAFRAWGVAWDCATWDVRQGDAFVAEHFGERGEAPEKNLGPYPTDNGVFRERDATSTV